MPSIERVNVSSVMNRQMNSIGEARGAVKSALRRLAARDGRGGIKLSSGQSGQISRKSRVGAGFRVYGMPYGEDGFSIFYYRSGDQDEDAHRNLARFKGGETDASVWALYLGRFDGNELVVPQHDNTPTADEDEAA